MIVVHHEAIRRRIKPAYTVGEVRDLRALLDKQGTLTFSPLPTGLYPAAGIDSLAATHSGYGNVWVRDNIYIALALEADGHREAATTVANTLAAFYRKYRGRFEAIVERRIDPQEPMNRPQVRFNGLHLVENAPVEDLFPRTHA